MHDLTASPQNGVLSEKEPTYNERAYTVTLAPGVVRYLNVNTFIQTDVENVLSELSKSFIEPCIKSPNGKLLQPNDIVSDIALYFDEVDELVKDESWQNRLRVHHALGRLLLQEGLPSFVYFHFHQYLQMGKHFAFAECLEAWVRGTVENSDLANSYAGSPEHIVLRAESPQWRFCVFKITEFVKERVEAIAQELGRQKLEKALLVEKQREIIEEQQTIANQEILRKSYFNTFIYIMEDARNGAFKIGRSRTPGKRERTLQSEAPEIILRFSIPGNEAHEKELHRRFTSKRLRGEWFTLTEDDLLTAIAFLKSNGDIPRASVDYEWLGALYFRANGFSQVGIK